MCECLFKRRLAKWLMIRKKWIYFFQQNKLVKLLWLVMHRPRLFYAQGSQVLQLWWINRHCTSFLPLFLSSTCTGKYSPSRIFENSLSRHRLMFSKRLIKMNWSFFLLSEFFFHPLLGHARLQGRCWAAIRLSHRPEPSVRAVRGEIDGLDIGGRHGRRFVLLRHTHRPQRRPYPICTSRSRNVRHRCGGG